MTFSVTELVEKILKDSSQGAPDDRDVTALCEVALGQKDAIEQLAKDLESNTSRLDDALDQIQALTTQANLVQYSDDATGY